MWAQIINSILGLWVMVSPGILVYPENQSTDISHIIGPLVVTFAVTAWWEASRGVRKWNIATGGALIILPFILGVRDATVVWNDILSGGLIVFFSFFKGKISQQFGGGWSSLFQKNPEHLQIARQQKERVYPE